MRYGLFVICLSLAVAVLACDNQGDTIVVTSDCGLIRTDLLGSWSVTFQPTQADLFNCSDPAFDNLTVTVPSGPFIFDDMAVFASAANVGFQFFSTSGSPSVITGNIETDSCNMLFAFLDDEAQYLQCIGTFDRQAGILQGFCDSTTVLETPLSDPPIVLADCDLDPILQVILTVQ